MEEVLQYTDSQIVGVGIISVVDLERRKLRLSGIATTDNSKVSIVYSINFTADSDVEAFNMYSRITAGLINATYHDYFEAYVAILAPQYVISDEMKTIESYNCAVYSNLTIINTIALSDDGEQKRSKMQIILIIIGGCALCWFSALFTIAYLFLQHENSRVLPEQPGGRYELAELDNSPNTADRQRPQ